MYAKLNHCNLHVQPFTLLYSCSIYWSSLLTRSNSLSRLIDIKETVSDYRAYTSVRWKFGSLLDFFMDSSLQQIECIKIFSGAHLLYMWVFSVKKWEDIELLSAKIFPWCMVREVSEFINSSSFCGAWYLSVCVFSLKSCYQIRWHISCVWKRNLWEIYLGFSWFFFLHHVREATVNLVDLAAN